MSSPALSESATGTELVAPLRVLLAGGTSGRGQLSASLSTHGLATLVVPQGEVPAQVTRGQVDVVLLPVDVVDASAEIAALRRHCPIPIVVLLRSGQKGAAAVERYLLAGADECLPGNVTGAELASRVRTVLRRRSRSELSDVVRLGPVLLDIGRHVCLARGKDVHLPPKEFGLLELLMRRDGRVVGRQEAFDRVWAGGAGPRLDVSSDITTVNVHVKRLRGRLEVDPSRPRHLLTVRGLGYRFVG